MGVEPDDTPIAPEMDIPTEPITGEGVREPAPPATVPEITYICPRCHKTFSRNEERCSDGDCRAPRPESGWWMLPHRFLDRFIWLAQIGRGGMGAVYLAEPVGGGRRVALKVSQAGEAASRNRERFERELQFSPMLASRDVSPRVGTFDLDATAPFMCMEFVDWPTLEALVWKTTDDGKRHRVAFHPTRAARVAIGILASVAKMHHVKIVHRDLKPANLFVKEGHDKNGKPVVKVKIADLGLASIEPMEGDDQSYPGGNVLGTWGYMSPEQMDGLRADHRSDLFATGVLLWLVAIGTLPFPVPKGKPAEKRDRLKEAVLAGPPAKPGEVPQGLYDVMARALQADVRRRFQTAEEMRAALEGFLTAEEARRAKTLERVKAIREEVRSEAGQLRAAFGRVGDAMEDLEEVERVVEESADTPGISEDPITVERRLAEAQKKLAEIKALVPVQGRRRWPLVAAGVVACVVAGLLGFFTHALVVGKGSVEPPASTTRIDPVAAKPEPTPASPPSPPVTTGDATAQPGIAPTPTVTAPTTASTPDVPRPTDVAVLVPPGFDLLQPGMVRPTVPGRSYGTIRFETGSVSGAEIRMDGKPLTGPFCQETCKTPYSHTFQRPSNCLLNLPYKVKVVFSKPGRISSAPIEVDMCNPPAMVKSELRLRGPIGGF